MGPLYAAYGSYLAKQHPGAFLKYFLWPNIVNYYVPKTEFLGKYNMGKDTVEAIAKNWFGYPTNKVSPTGRVGQIGITEVFPILLAITNLVFILSLIGFALLGGFKKGNPTFNRTIAWTFIVWCSNVGFSVLASPIVLRYQVFPMIVTFTFMAILLSFIIRESRAGQGERIINQRNTGIGTMAPIQ